MYNNKKFLNTKKVVVEIKIYEKLAVYINENGVKQIWLASQIGISNKTLNSVLRGRHRLTMDLYEEICKKLNVNPEYFFANKFLETKKGVFDDLRKKATAS